VELTFIGDRSSILWEQQLLPPENCSQKNYENAPQITKDCAKIAFFIVHFPYLCCLKIF